MEEQNKPQFRGVWIPADIMNMQAEGKLKAADVVLLAIIDSLVAPDHGCYASNEYLAARVGIHFRKVRERIAKLKTMGLVKQVKFDGRRRHLETAWSRVGTTSQRSGRPVEGPKTAGQRGRKRHGTYKEQSKENSLSGPVGPDGEGFGIVPPQNGKATAFDIAIATKLLDAIRTLPPRVTRIGRAKPSTWANHIRLLRTINKVPEVDIWRVAGWYGDNIGKEFVPEAYSGEGFRKKFASIERQCGRDINTVVINVDALSLAKKLVPMGWPKGSGKDLPAAVQTCLTGYRIWLAKRDKFVERLRRDDLSINYGAERSRLLNLGEYLIGAMPPPLHFVQEWMEAVNKRVHNWAKWGGGLAPFVFGPEAKQFQTMGHGWAMAYSGDHARWDRFCAAMEKEL